MGSELPDYHKEDSTMFFLFVFFLLHPSVTSVQECPDEKKVGNTCYTKVGMIDTTEYGCMENCTYKKTLGSDSGHYCFKHGILPVTESECVYNGTDITITDNPACIELENTQAVTVSPVAIAGYFPFNSINKQTCAYYCWIFPACNIWNYNYEYHLCWLMEQPGLPYPFGGAVLGNKACGAGGPTTNEELTSQVSCGDGQRVRLCNECPDNEAGCSSDDCEFFDGKCVPRMPETFSENRCLACIRDDCPSCLAICEYGTGLSCLQCIGDNCRSTCGPRCGLPSQ